MGITCGGLGGWGHMGGWTGVGWIGPLFGAAFLVGIFALVTLGAVWVARRAGPERSSGSGLREDPLDLARRRLAAGEIDATEFEEIRDRLRH